VTAAGRGPLAQRILDTAEAAGVVVVEDAALSALLETVEPGSLVPWECWEAVARILALIAREENI
jgi:flagellar biosynthesis protein